MGWVVEYEARPGGIFLVKLDRRVVFDWDPWQRKVLGHRGNITIRAGRQVGKSEVISQKAVDFALENADTVTLIIAASQRQSGLLFEKVRGRLDLMGVDYPEKPTLTRIVLPNGSRIYSLPAGRTAYSIRGFTIDLLIADEAAYIPETVWLAVTPMLAVSKTQRGFGWLITISTPYGKGGYFFNTFSDPDFLSIHVSSEDCKRIDRHFLKKERERMTKAQYRQEYLGEFTDEWNQFFPTDLIKRQMTFLEWSLVKDRVFGGKFYLGVDIARYGGDENAFVVVELFRNRLKLVKVMTTERVSTVDTIGRVVDLHERFGFKKIFIDDAGVGGGVTDILTERFGRRVVGLNNASKRLVIQGDERKKGILKEDLYSNALMLLETGRLEMLDDPLLRRSLKSITFQYGALETGNTKIKIFGDYSHVAEAMVRACWCVKEKGLDLYIA